MKSTNFIILLLFGCATTDAVADVCEYVASNFPDVRTVTLPAVTSIPRDVPTGTVIYEALTITYAGSNSWTCSGSFLSGIKNLAGVDVSGTVQPIGDTGIGWQWVYGGTPYRGIKGGNIQKAGRYGFNGTAHSIKFIKIGTIKDNAKIPAGVIGAFQAGTLRPFTLETTGMSLVVPSCETPDVIVDMGSYDLSEFSDKNSNSTPRRFNIKLNNCPAGIKKVNYRFATTAAAPAIDSNQGVISLNSNSTASGIALQILDSKQDPINLNLTHVFNDYNNSGGSFEIPLFARYYKKKETYGDASIKAGSANSEVIFIMSYL